MLPVASTANTPPGPVTELVLDEDLLDTLEELTELLVVTMLDELERELLDGGNTEDEELERLDVVTLELEDTPQPGAAVKPNGEGCEVQVDLEIQLLLFSYPQPLWVVTHTG